MLQIPPARIGMREDEVDTPALLIDLDEVPELERRLRLFGCGRLSLIGFREQDHGPLGAARPEGSLADWVRHQCIAAGLEAGGAIRVLCFPRLLGLVFNPLSVYFCHRVDGSLAAILYEVSNTFGERHGYLIPAEPDADGLVRHSCAKEFYVGSIRVKSAWVCQPFESTGTYFRCAHIRTECSQQVMRPCRLNAN